MAAIDLHTGIPTSPKHAPLSDAAFRLWVHALCWSKEHLTDGFIPSAMLPALHPRGPEAVGELVRSVMPGKGPLWHEADGGYQIHDYDQWQESKARVQSRRQYWRDKKAGQRRGSEGVSNGVSRGDTHGDTRGDSSGESRKESSRESHGVSRRVSSHGCGISKELTQTPPSPPSVGESFASFWQAYPRHVGKAAALRAWTRLAPSPDLVATILDALAWQGQQAGWLKDDGAFIPHASTWLNQRRWEDERPTTATRLDAVNGHDAIDFDVPYAPTTRPIEGW